MQTMKKPTIGFMIKARRIGQKPIKTWVYLAAIMPGLSAISGCGQSRWDAGVQNYAQRAATVFNATHNVPPTHHDALKYPSRRELTLALPASSIGMIDFLRLSQCDLQRLVGLRNSGLGKVMPASQLAFYNVQFINLAQTCLSQNLVPQDLIEPLEQTLTQKRQALPLILWNALFASPEFAKLYSLSDRANPSTNTQIPSELAGALEQLQKITASLLQQAAISSATEQKNKRNAIQDASFTSRQQVFEQALSVIASSSYAGRLALQNSMLSQQLNETYRQLNNAWQAKPLCKKGANGKLLIKRGSKEALQNVLHKYYIPEVQGLAVKLLKQSDALTEQLQALVTLLQSHNSRLDNPLNSQPFNHYWQNVWGVNGTSAQLRLEIKNHTEFWQQVLKQCNLSPSA